MQLGRKTAFGAVHQDQLRPRHGQRIVRHACIHNRAHRTCSDRNENIGPQAPCHNGLCHCIRAFRMSMQVELKCLSSGGLKRPFEHRAHRPSGGNVELLQLLRHQTCRTLYRKNAREQHAVPNQKITAGHSLIDAARFFSPVHEYASLCRSGMRLPVTLQYGPYCAMVSKSPVRRCGDGPLFGQRCFR